MEKKQKGSETEEERSLLKSNDNKRDYISALPDEILSSIISLLTIREAARSSLASRRWGYLCASMPELDFDWENVFVVTPENGNAELCVCQCEFYKERFIEIVDQNLKSFVGQKVIKFSVDFCLERGDGCYLDQWISFAVKMGVELLVLRLSCNKPLIPGKPIQLPDLYCFPCYLLPCGGVSKLKYLVLQSTIFGPNLTDQFSNLERLVLMNVTLSQSDVKTIFCSCFKLEVLALNSCSFPDDKLCISASLRSLRFVTLFCCFGVDEIELSVNSLAKFEYVGWEVKLSFLEVSSLETVYIRLPSESGYGYTFNQIGRGVPRIKTLSTFMETFQLDSFPRGLTIFSKIKQLELYCYLESEFDAEKVIAIVRTCTLLKKLCIVTRCLPPAHDEQRRVYDSEPAKEIHQHLNEVEIGGFRGTWNHIGFAIYLLKHALALEWLVVKPQSKFYGGTSLWIPGERTSWDEGERERVCEQLKEQVCSKNLMLIIR